MAKIKLSGVSYVYSAGTPYEIKALDDINLEIKEGTITGIIGHTGSGKSTLVQLLNGLEKPTCGTVFLDSNDIWAKPKEISRVRFKVGLVMQYPEYQLFEETVWKDIAFGPQNMGLSRQEINDRIKMAADFVGVTEDMLEKSPFDLSGGQKRRVAIAGVIAMKPEVLILDEPAAGLDPRGRDDIFESILKYRNETGATVVIVSHSMEDMAKLCDDIIVMARSQIIMHGSCEDIFSRTVELEKIGLAIPQITKLVLALRRRGVDIGSGIYTVETATTEIAKFIDKYR